MIENSKNYKTDAIFYDLNIGRYVTLWFSKTRSVEDILIILISDSVGSNLTEIWNII